ncbi:MAG: PucR family transcriptional regulator, purine catabolism regulatory protein [Actinomycetota bacterium]|jgi:purine catabolism regulator|nr:PucR family transcriptional regulator, purine catabolism regulatory protein [Actinomycetota bacterium]
MATTLADVLRLPVVRAGRPVVLTGGELLDRAVRWVHVSELPDIGPLLRGGELILTTGVALPRSSAKLGRFVETLQEAQACALVIELGRRFEVVPDAMVQAAEAVGLPVIALRRTVRFVSITEEVHGLIVGEQHELLRSSQAAHLEFTRLSIEGASMQAIIEKVSELSGTAVVLEDLTHRAVVYACENGAAGELLEDWEVRSRLAAPAETTVLTGPEGWLVTPVGPRNQRWGRLVAPAPPPAEAQLAMLLERGAEALAINRLVERDRATLVQQAHRGLLRDLTGGRASDEAELRTRANALGLPVSRRSYLGVAVQSGSPHPLDPVIAESRDRALAEAVTSAAAEAGLPALVATLRSGQSLMLAAVSTGQSAERALNRFAENVTRRLQGLPWWNGSALGVGREASTLTEAAHSLNEAAHVAEAGLAIRSTHPRPYYRSTDVRLRGLLALLRDDPRLLAFADAELGPLLRYDSGHSTDLLATLRMYFDAGGNKSHLARLAHLSRPALYARLSTIERVLGVSLTEPESAAALNLAVLATDVSARALATAT